MFASTIARNRLGSLEIVGDAAWCASNRVIAVCRRSGCDSQGWRTLCKRPGEVYTIRLFGKQKNTGKLQNTKKVLPERTVREH